MRYTPEAAALLPSAAIPSNARTYVELVCTHEPVTKRDVQRVYAAYRMLWEWELYKSAVLAGDPQAAYVLSKCEGVAYGSLMGCDPSEVDIVDWVRFLDNLHAEGEDWWSVVDYSDDEDCE